ncbi:MAG: SDR family oxidoreductase [Rhodospirillaceae bacterium]|nr:SDR family oxidoreductase [Rhodospirillaceae bacterium]MBT4426489.1 SDR family oxidoreductase [Rhodospirillaceae bacterium]MBT5039076.1 SDR family oxidoreductase [Rhodospirillaceae bacterium]
MNSLAGKRAIITGGGRGIGRAAAERFLAAGAKVHICCVTEDSLESVLADNPGLSGSLADVGDADQVAQLFTDAAAHLGGLDILVNNAGIGDPRAPIEEVTDAEWRHAFAVNIDGMFFCIKRAVPLLKEAGGGAIINISTASTRTGLPFRTPYIASKWAVEGLSDNLARELGPHKIRCNAILPGIIDNPRGRRLVERIAAERGQDYSEAEEHYFSFVSTRSWIEPGEVADMAVFLASDAARNVTGQAIGVCGNLEWEE